MPGFTRMFMIFRARMMSHANSIHRIIAMDSQPKTNRRIDESGSIERREADLVAPAFYRIGDVLRITTLSRPTLYRRMAVGRFPRPVHLGGRACGWHQQAVQLWVADPDNYCLEASVEAPVVRGRGRPLKYFRRA
jgi:predicted DNA-binding transcriptional regulator AlpA